MTKPLIFYWFNLTFGSLTRLSGSLLYLKVQVLELYCMWCWWDFGVLFLGHNTESEVSVHKDN